MTSSQGDSISLTWTVYRLHRSQEPWGISQSPNLGPVWTEAKSMPTRFCWNFSGQTPYLPWFLTRRPHDCQATWLHRDVRNHFQSDPIWCYPILTYLPIYQSTYLPIYLTCLSTLSTYLHVVGLVFLSSRIGLIPLTAIFFWPQWAWPISGGTLLPRPWMRSPRNFEISHDITKWIFHSQHVEPTDFDTYLIYPTTL